MWKLLRNPVVSFVVPLAAAFIFESLSLTGVINASAGLALAVIGLCLAAFPAAFWVHNNLGGRHRIISICGVVLVTMFLGAVLISLELNGLPAPRALTAEGTFKQLKVSDVASGQIIVNFSFIDSDDQSHVFMPPRLLEAIIDRPRYKDFKKYFGWCSDFAVAVSNAQDNSIIEANGRKAFIAAPEHIDAHDTINIPAKQVINKSYRYNTNYLNRNEFSGALICTIYRAVDVGNAADNAVSCPAWQVEDFAEGSVFLGWIKAAETSGINILHKPLPACSPPSRGGSLILTASCLDWKFEPTLACLRNPDGSPMKQEQTRALQESIARGMGAPMVPE